MITNKIKLGGSALLIEHWKNDRRSLLLRLNKGGCAGFLVTTRILMRPTRNHIILVNATISLVFIEGTATYLSDINLRLESSSLGTEIFFGGNNISSCACGQSVGLSVGRSDLK